MKKLKTETTPKNIWIDESVCLRSKAYSFKSSDKNSNELKNCFKLTI